MQCTAKKKENMMHYLVRNSWSEACGPKALAWHGNVTQKFCTFKSKRSTVRSETMYFANGYSHLGRLDFSHPVPCGHTLAGY
jgi:hypothetical protein